MSYDLHLFPPEPGIDLAESARASLERDLEDEVDTPVDPAAEERKRRLTAALQSAVPHLEPFRFDHAEIARVHGISEEQARRSYRHVELNGSDEVGVQVTLFEDHVTITVPYWHVADRAVQAFREIWACLETLEREAGLRTFDAQLDDVVELDRDFETLLAKYAEGVEFTRTLSEPSRRKKPWWKFW
jgi:hypothetical protein